MIKDMIQRLVRGESLTMEEAGRVMGEIMSGTVTESQFGALVTALRCKGESVDEITGMVKTMRARAVPVLYDGNVVDTCGTGGDDAGTFNISTATAFVAAGAGINIAKHGNRAMSSRCGSADVLEALGCRVELTATQVRQSIEEVGIGFMFAPVFHPSMKYAAVPRREIGIRTVFNILGPLSNPAGVKAQVLGVADEQMAGKMAQVLCNLGCRHALVVHGEDGLDEITVSGETQIHEVRDGCVKSYKVDPNQFGIPVSDRNALRGGDAAENARIIAGILGGHKGPCRDIVVLNTAAVLLAGDMTDNMGDGIKLAEMAIDTGRAQEKLERLIVFSKQCG